MHPLHMETGWSLRTIIHRIANELKNLSLLQDLIEEDVMILDTYSEVYVWIGRGANEVEKKESLKAAVDYIKTDPSNRDLDSTLLLQV